MTTSQAPNLSSTDSQRKIRYAVVGLGWFAHAENAELLALVSDDPTKRQELSKKYGVERTYSYEEYDECLASGKIDAVYIALPNHPILL